MKLFCALLSLVLVAFCAGACSAAPTYRIEALGLTDAEHTRGDGYQFSEAYQLSESGYVTGMSRRYGGASDLGRSAWFYDGVTTQLVGLVDSEHTRADGYKESATQYRLNEAGQVQGYSRRYAGSTDLGRSAWFYNGSSTMRIGFTDSEHTRDDGYRYSVGLNLNEDGIVLGYSDRFLGGTDRGRSAWLYNDAATVNIGLIGHEHTRDDGYRNSYSFRLDDSGRVIGNSNRYNEGSALLGTSAWLFDGITTLELGLTGPEFTRSDGYESSGAYDFNSLGQVSGYTDRFNSGMYPGRSAWIYDGTSVVEIGLSDSEHTRADGYRSSEPRTLQLNDLGQVAGTSERYNGGPEFLGYSAWLYDGSTTITVGLTGSEHTRADGYRNSNAQYLNDAGQVAGTSDRYSGLTSMGRSAWLYDGGSATNVGLVDAEHTRSDGHKFSEIWELNNSGDVLGYSWRVSGNSDLGQSVWFHNNGMTREIGLGGSAHTRTDGYRRSTASNLNEAGQVIGSTNRYGGTSELGQDAWIYDSALDQTFTLQLSMRSDGYAYSVVDYLGEDGLALGYYTLFDEFDNDLGSRGFYFSVADGLHDLGSLVEGGLPTVGWNYLAAAIRANGAGQIVGFDLLTPPSEGQVAFLLTPITADFDNDGGADGRDFLAWQRGESPRPLSAEDLALWHEQYAGANAVSALNNVAAVPEPSGLALLLGSLLFAARVRAR